jgi:hypothetical protein
MKGAKGTGLEFSLVTGDLYANLQSQGLEV